MDTRERNKITKKIVSEIITFLEEETIIEQMLEKLEEEDEKELKEKLENIVRYNIPVTVVKK